MSTFRWSRLRRFLPALIVTALVLFWWGGVAGWILHRWVLPGLLPGLRGEVRIDRYATGGAPLPDRVDDGVLVRVRPERVRRALHGWSVWTRLAPTGLVPNEALLEAAWIPGKELSGVTGSIPVRVMIDAQGPDAPVLEARLPVGMLNAILDRQASTKWKKRREWILGHYEEATRAHFFTLTIRSHEGVTPSCTERKVRFEATGTYRYRWQDGILKASATAAVQQLDGVVQIRLDRARGDVGVEYDARIETLRAAVDNLAPWAETKVADDLRNLFEESLNREKNKARLRVQRFPPWFPYDVQVDVHFEQERGL